MPINAISIKRANEIDGKNKIKQNEYIKKCYASAQIDHQQKKIYE